MAQYSDDTELFRLADLIYLQDKEQTELTVDMPLVSVLQDLDTETYRYTKPGYWNSIGNDTDEDVTVYINGGSAGTVIKAGEYPTFAVEIKNVRVKGKARYCATNDWDAVTDRYYLRFGLDKVVIPSDCTTLSALWDTVVTRVKETFYQRFIGSETLEMWQIRLQVLTDHIARRYERMFNLYTKFSDRIDEDVVHKMVTEYKNLMDSASGTRTDSASREYTPGVSDTSTTSHSGSDTTTSTGRVTDTPDVAINDDGLYAGQTTRESTVSTPGVTDTSTLTHAGKDTTSDSSSASTSSTNTRTGSVEVTDDGENGILPQLNENLRIWMDIESDLVDEYGKCFLHIMWY